MGATRADLKPESRKGGLDKDCLKKHGLTEDQMKMIHVLLPAAISLQNITLTGIEDDRRMAYFSQVSICKNVHASANGTGSGISHHWVRTLEMEMVCWTGIPFCHGAYDGKPGTIPT